MEGAVKLCEKFNYRFVYLLLKLSLDLWFLKHFEVEFSMLLNWFIYTGTQCLHIFLHIFPANIVLYMSLI